MTSESPWAKSAQQFQQIFGQSWSQALQSFQNLNIGAQVPAAAPLKLKSGTYYTLEIEADGSQELALEGGHDGVIQILPNGAIGDLVAYSPEQIKSATGNSGQFDPTNPDIRFSRSAAPSLSEVAETGRDTAWTGPAASKWDDFIYKMQDKHIDTKRALEAVRATQQKILI